MLIGRITLDRARLRTPVTIGGRGPFSFLIDTGAAGSGIDDDLAHALGLASVAERQVSGFGGEGHGVVTLYQARNVVLGGAMEAPNVAFTGLPSFRGTQSGLLAASVLTAYDADIDFLNQQWRVYPKGRPALVDHVRLDATIDSAGFGSASRLIVKARLDGWTGRFLLDTGAPGALALDPHSGVARRYWNDARPFVAEETGGILGRDLAPSRLVRGEKLELGPLTMSHPLITVRSPDLPAGVGAGSLDRLDGVIGLNLIRQLNLAFDVSRHAIWVQPSGVPNPPEPSYNLTGLWLDRSPGERGRIVALSPGSPAAEAGLKLGEMVETGGFTAFIRRAHRPGPFDVAVERNGAVETVRLELRPYL